MTKFAQKIISPTKNEKVNITTEFCVFELVKLPNLSLNWQFRFFGPNLPKKEYLIKIGKKWTAYEFCIFKISRYQTSASRIKFAPKWYFQSKTEKVNSTTKFCIFKLVLVPNFSLIWQFWFSRPNLSKKGISSLNQKKMNTTSKFCIFKSVYIPNFSLNWQF